MGIFQRPLPSLAQATFLKHYLHGRLHRGRIQADHTLCAKACMTHTNTHNWSWESGSVDNTPLA